MNTSMSRKEMRARYDEIDAARTELKEQQEDLLEETLNHILRDQSITSRDKILLQMRADEECLRRETEHHRSAYVPKVVSYQSSISLETSRVAERFSSWLNTTTALYIFDERQHFPYIHAMGTESWLWRQWFKPYVSDITLHHFASIFTVQYDRNHADCKFNSEKLVAFHCNACEQAQRVKDTAYTGEGDEPTLAFCGPLRSQPWPQEKCNFFSRTYSTKAAYTIQPLFQALFMALFYPQGDIDSPRTPEEIRAVKVQLILTGITEGLSAPISFEELEAEALDQPYHPGATAITTSLDAAVRFIMRLEQREIAASGGILQPNVAKLRGWNQHREQAKKLGWIENRDGKLDDLTPRSCEWVNRDIFKTWVGKGALETLWCAMYMSILNPLLEDSEENWWWDRKLLPKSPKSFRPSGL
ncbi:hypothetical protein F4782DRAFT_552853 [Xylaria castorea]|nr:hypothetical protein F4782DRAFT_552853 [Xylaria castorea]